MTSKSPNLAGFFCALVTLPLHRLFPYFACCNPIIIHHYPPPSPPVLLPPLSPLLLLFLLLLPLSTSSSSSSPPSAEPRSVPIVTFSDKLLPQVQSLSVTRRSSRVSHVHLRPSKSLPCLLLCLPPHSFLAPLHPTLQARTYLRTVPSSSPMYLPTQLHLLRHIPHPHSLPTASPAVRSLHRCQNCHLKSMRLHTFLGPPQLLV